MPYIGWLETDGLISPSAGLKLGSEKAKKWSGLACCGVQYEENGRHQAKEQDGGIEDSSRRPIHDQWSDDDRSDTLCSLIDTLCGTDYRTGVFGQSSVIWQEIDIRFVNVCAAWKRSVANAVIEPLKNSSPTL